MSDPAEPFLGPVVFDAEQIASRVAALGQEITSDYQGKVPVLVTVLKGATIFAADLSRQIGVQHEMDFMALSAYGEEQSGYATVLKDVQIALVGRDVILLEDIIDTGLTLGFILRWLSAHEPRSLKVCALLDRPHRRLVDADIAYRGFTAPDRFCVGYGFDYRQQYRNLPDLCELAWHAGDDLFNRLVSDPVQAQVPTGE